MKILKRLILALIPYCVALLVLIYVCYIKIISINNLKDIITSTINFITVIIGFLSTMLSILIASSDKNIMKYLKDKGKINTLYRYILVPILIGFINIIISLALLPYCEVKPIYSLLIFKVFIIFTVSFISTAIRAIVILVVLVTEFNNNDGETEDDDRPINLENAFINNKDKE